MTGAGEWQLVLTAPARRALSDRLPGAVVTAVIDFLTSSALMREPRRVGKPLRAELAGIWSARRGTYRILFRIVEHNQEVVVLRIERWRDVYWT